MRPAFRRGWEGEGKPESMPWRGPGGTARHTGVSIPVWGTRGQSPWRSCPDRTAIQQTTAPLQRREAAGRPARAQVRKRASAIREARVPAGQGGKHRTLRSAQCGTECDCKSSRSASVLLIVTRMGRDYRRGPRQRIEQVALGQPVAQHDLIDAPYETLWCNRLTGDNQCK